MLGLRKPNLKTKIIPFEKSHNAENCKSAEIIVANFQKIEGGPFGVFKNIRKKNKKKHVLTVL